MQIPKIEGVLGNVMLIAFVTVTIVLVLGYFIGATGLIPSAYTALNASEPVKTAVGGQANFDNLYNLSYMAVGFVAVTGVIGLVLKGLKFW